MATKAQEFRAEAQRTGHAKKRAPPHVTEERISHNEAHRLNSKSTHALEQSGASPEARATRKSGNPM